MSKPLLTALLLTFLATPAFADGTGSGLAGKGFTTSVAGGKGRNTSDELSELGFATGGHPGGVGITAARPSSGNLNKGPETTDLSTGGGPRHVASAAPTYLATNGKSHIAPNVRGVGITSASPGGLGF